MRVLALALVLSAAGWPAEPREIDLAQAYRSALKRSEELAIRGEAVAELTARVDELWSSARPKIRLQGTELIQDVPPAASGVSSTFSQRRREEARIAARQPLFAGFREYLAARAAQSRTAAAELSLRRAEQLLYQDVARAYLDLLGLQDELRTRQALVEITEDRVKDLGERQKLGRSRRSEVLAAQAQLAQLQAQIETAKGSESVAQSQLAFLTGLDADLRPLPVAPPPPEPVEPFLEKARARPDVEASRKELRAAELGVPVASRAAWPTVAADANYYLKRPPGFQDRVKWDVLLSAELPLYLGGSIAAQTRQARARERAASQSLALSLRRAELEVRSAHRDLGSAINAARALEKAAELADANAKAQAEDYRLGQVTNLDVLGALNTLQETRLRLNEARIDAYWSRVRLDVAAGTAAGEAP